MVASLRRRRRSVRWFLAALLVAGASRPALAVVNTCYDASGFPFVACNGRVAFRVPESGQNDTDLNADGDSLDLVLHVLDLGSGVVTNVGVDAGGPLACGGDTFAFGVREAAEGNLDRNGDGDMFDTVLAVYDAGTATLTDVGLAVTAIVASPSLIAFTVGEASQGGTSLNGDADVLDSVLQVLDPGTLAVTNVGREAADAAHIVVDGQRVAFFLSESAQGSTDFNGDGDPLDVVALVYDAGTATLVNPHRAVVPELGIQLDSAAAAFVVSEAGQGNVSGNPDLDSLDALMSVYCFAAPACILPGVIDLGVDASGGFTLAGDLLALRTREKNQAGQNLNPPDTDTRDTVVQYYRLSTGVLKNTQLAGQARVRVVGNVLAFGVPERLQNHALLNGDLDFRDVVLTLYDTVTETVTNTGRALWSRSCRREATEAVPKGPCLAAADDLILLASGEKEQNRTDLNGDLDAHDAVIQAWRISTGTLTSTGLAGEHKGALVGQGTLTAFRVSEADQGHLDRNGDLDASDRTIAVYDPTTTTTTDLGQAADPPVLIEGRTVVFRTSEQEQNVDLNGDGDQKDAVIQYQTF